MTVTAAFKSSLDSSEAGLCLNVASTFLKKSIYLPFMQTKLFLLSVGANRHEIQEITSTSYDNDLKDRSAGLWGVPKIMDAKYIVFNPLEG